MTKSLDKLLAFDHKSIASIEQLSESEKNTWTSETLRYLGYTTSHSISDLDIATQSTVNHVFSELQALRIPEPVWGIFDIHTSDVAGSIYLSNRPEIIESQSLWQHLKDYPTAAVLAATLGSSFDGKLKRLMLECPSDAIVYDAAGSALIEIIANRVECYLLQEAGDLAADSTFRFSPGYGDLHMKYNKMLLTLLRADKNCGITTTSGFAMTPKKSVVAVLGFRTAQAKPEKTELEQTASTGCRPGRSCDLCLMNNDCSYKR